MFPALRCVGATAIVGLALQGAAYGGGPPPDPRAAWLKLDPLFRIQHTMRSFAEPASGTSSLASFRADSVIAGFAEFTGSRDRLEALGARVGTQAGDLYTVRLTVANLERLAGDPRLRSFQVARPMSFHLHASGQVIGSPAIHEPMPGFPEGIQGQGVLVGVADSGIDLDAPDFKDAFGVTRLVGLWDQGFDFRPPPGFDYGTAYDAAELRAGGVPERDRIGHGTHVAGIAAGNGRATGRGIPALSHVGVAPRANVAIVRLDPFFVDVGLVDGVRYLFDLARSRGQDAVVNVSMGSEDSFTGAVPNPDWGAGKLDLTRLVEVANQTFVAGVHELSLSHDRNPSSSPVRFRILASVARAAASLEIFSVDGRKVVRKDIGPIRIGVTDLEWDPVVRGAALPTGVYFARVRAGGSEASDKIALLR